MLLHTMTGYVLPEEYLHRLRTTNHLLRHDYTRYNKLGEVNSNTAKLATTKYPIYFSTAMAATMGCGMLLWLITSLTNSSFLHLALAALIPSLLQ